MEIQVCLKTESWGGALAKKGVYNPLCPKEFGGEIKGKEEVVP